MVGLAIGIGDDLISSGIARIAQQSDPRKVRPMLEKGFRFSEVWRHNPRICQPGEEGDFQDVPVRTKFLRPYMTEKHSNKWVWKEYRPPPGEVYFNQEESDFGLRYGGRVILEPHNKAGASPNKQWPWVSWNKLAWLLQKRGLRVTQLGPGGTRLLDGVDFIETRNFRLAAAVMANARGVVVPEGGMHHAAAALNVPAVVIYGGFISPEVTGYDSQVNLFTGSELGCGMRALCRHCIESMAKIKPETVAQKFMEILNERSSTAQARDALVAAG